ncbi:unnamed protein product, partial [marine sediment metagenome]
MVSSTVSAGVLDWLKKTITGKATYAEQNISVIIRGTTPPEEGNGDGSGGGGVATCQESWTCEAWSNCIGNLQNRTCNDTNYCEEPYTKIETKECIPE